MQKDPFIYLSIYFSDKRLKGNFSCDVVNDMKPSLYTSKKTLVPFCRPQNSLVHHPCYLALWLKQATEGKPSVSCTVGKDSAFK